MNCCSLNSGTSRACPSCLCHPTAAGNPAEQREPAGTIPSCPTCAAWNQLPAQGQEELHISAGSWEKTAGLRGLWNPPAWHQPAIRLTLSNYETAGSLQASFKVVFLYCWHVFAYQMHSLIITQQQVCTTDHFSTTRPFLSIIRRFKSVLPCLRPGSCWVAALKVLKITHLGKYFLKQTGLSWLFMKFLFPHSLLTVTAPPWAFHNQRNHHTSASQFPQKLLQQP